ncbi:hypothetical protein T492DRAFT_50226 [Pavlovales sp. CCMP2436]|nr:hypothetical protein T492DRAFT_50226 [Pavlovales sp. CCMP2436]
MLHFFIFFILVLLLAGECRRGAAKNRRGCSVEIRETRLAVRSGIGATGQVRFPPLLAGYLFSPSPHPPFCETSRNFAPGEFY